VRSILALSLLPLLACRTAPDPVPPGAERVILVTTDGFRWQEVFGGAEESLMTKQAGGVRDAAGLKREFWRDAPEARREALLPFLWGVVGREGQIFGNPARGSSAQITNGKKFSYPGYSEMLCGFPDPRIDSNDKKPNPNVNVLEWLNGRPGFRGRVAAFCSWDVFPFILNRERSGLAVLAGHEPIRDDPLSEVQAGRNLFARDAGSPWPDSALDGFTHQAALEHLKRHRPRVLYVAYGETDEWAHSGKYDLYLQAAHRVDRFIRELWETAQSMPEYRGRTSLVITTDHGRGDAPVEWKSHGEKVAGAERIWLAALGPRVAPLGERANAPAVTQSQVAATVAALAGEDYRAAIPQAAQPIGLTR
jgi:hypothetical protein